MTVEQLLARLETLPLKSEVMILDGFNGGGLPREINLGPVWREVTPEMAQECDDCAPHVGHPVLVIGYGCY